MGPTRNGFSTILSATISSWGFNPQPGDRVWSSQQNCDPPWLWEKTFLVTHCPFNATPPSQQNIDVSINVDFTSFIDDVSLTQDKIVRWVTISIGASDAIEDVVENARPIYVTPGAQLFGVCEFSVRQRFVNPSVAAIGIPQVSGYTTRFNILS